MTINGVNPNSDIPAFGVGRRDFPPFVDRSAVQQNLFVHCLVTALIRYHDFPNENYMPTDIEPETGLTYQELFLANMRFCAAKHLGAGEVILSSTVSSLDEESELLVARFAEALEGKTEEEIIGILQPYVDEYHQLLTGEIEQSEETIGPMGTFTQTIVDSTSEDVTGA